MSGKVFFGLLTTVLLTTAPHAQAQQPGKVYRVGRLSGGYSSSTEYSINALRRELRELGYVEGKNIIFEFRYAEEKPERQQALAAELAHLKLDLIIAGGPNDGLAAKKATKTIPIVFTDSPADPVARGLVDSLARPGGNVTGFYSMADVLSAKRLEVLKDSIPKLTRVGVLRYSGSGADEPQWKESQLAARQLGLQLFSMEISKDNYESAFKEAIKKGATGLAVVRHRALQATQNQKRIIALAAKYRLPAIHYREDFVENGGLMSMVPTRSSPSSVSRRWSTKFSKGPSLRKFPSRGRRGLSLSSISRPRSHST
jgi:putative ABC transport system substrate-binding protein